jgi:opacity protein-like surface antigen
MKNRFKQLYISVAILLAALACDYARSVEVEISAGRSYTKTAPNGVWRQEGFAYTQNKYASTQRIALTGVPLDSLVVLGYEFNMKWLKAQVDYTNFGQTNGDTQYVSDENYSGNPSNPCRNPCEVLRSAYWTARSSGVGFSALPTWQATDWLQINVRAGAMFYRAENKITALNFHDAFVVDPNPSIGNYDSYKNGFSWYYGAGVRVQPIKHLVLSAEYAHAPRIMTGFDGVARGTKRVMVGAVINIPFGK